MKTIPTAEQFFKNHNSFDLTYDDMLKEFAKLHLEALRSELKDEFHFDHQLEIIDEVINNRLNELK